MNRLSSELHTILKKYYGYDSFRPYQQEIIESALNGGDSLVLMPTGGGKSICFQLPALVLEGVTIVISPLLALMKDQVDGLISNGIAAAALNSSQSGVENARIIDDVLNQRIKLLYISPERLTGEIDSLLQQIPVALFAIDEAHCISQWGHDFRPEYNKLAILKEKFPDVPVMALTATADKITREDIVAQLRLKNPRVFITSFDRPNLNLKVVQGLNKQQKLSSIFNFIQKHQGQSGIIYCLSRSSTEQVAQALTDQGIKSVAYHAGLSPHVRENTQNLFLNDEVQVICATIAFGMGIDKSNIRWVIHYNLPKSIECFYQEIGRAGRDGMPADTLLFYSLADVVLLSKFAQNSGQQTLNTDKLYQMQQYAESFVCRRRILLNYFNEATDHDCNNCDVCKDPPQRFDGTVLAQKALSAIVRTNEQIGTLLLIDILRGSARTEITENGYHLIKTYGLGRDLTFRQWQGYLLQMLQLGYFEIQYNKNNLLKVTDLGWKILRNEENAMFTHVSIDTPEKKGKKQKPAPFVPVLSDEERLFESLSALRKTIAAEEHVPPYIVFTDKTLHELVVKKPVSLFAFSQVSGVGEAKIRKYGTTFIEHLRKELNIKREKGDSLSETLEMAKKGLPIEKMVMLRDLKPTTLYSHLAQLITEKKLSDCSDYISVYEIEAVANAWRACDFCTEQKPIYENLNGSIDYGKIRLAQAILSLQKSK